MPLAARADAAMPKSNTNASPGWARCSVRRGIPESPCGGQLAGDGRSVVDCRIAQIASERLGERRFRGGLLMNGPHAPPGEPGCSKCRGIEHGEERQAAQTRQNT